MATTKKTTKKAPEKRFVTGKALKKVKRGDLVVLDGTKYAIMTSRNGSTGKMVCVHGDKILDVYYEPSDLLRMKRVKVSQVPKKLAEYSKTWRKGR